MRPRVSRAADAAPVPVWLRRLREFVEPLGPQEVARRAGKSRQQLEKILKGQNLNPTLGVLGDYARGAGHELEDLFTRLGDGPADEAKRTEGAVVLGRLLADVEAGTWEGDLARAIEAIASALRRADHQEPPRRSASRS
jgi:transcriptional regulator with XRE-family HTH domain